MTHITAPTPVQLSKLVAPYLATVPSGLGLVIGYASPALPDIGGLFFAGRLRNQFGFDIPLNAGTPFGIAGITKTFTATLYALLIRAFDPGLKIGDYAVPVGPMPINPALAEIALDQLVNYTSGLPVDHGHCGVAKPPYKAYPYSLSAMLSYLAASPPPLSSPGVYPTYSDLAFALMSGLIASEGRTSNPKIGAFLRKIREYIFEPLGLQAQFFTETSLATLPLGYTCSYGASLAPTYAATSPGSSWFPAYLGAGGVVATPNDMFQWLLFNMGIARSRFLSPLLPVLHAPSTAVRSQSSQFGLGWFITTAQRDHAASIWQDGELSGFSSYIAFLPSLDPGWDASRAGVFVLVNAEGIADVDGVELASVLANDILLIMQGELPLPDKSSYPSSARIAPRCVTASLSSPFGCHCTRYTEGTQGILASRG
jgi:serine-type D-Ala-D-Ala carboxypeptidase/endopeptidase